MYSIGSSMVMMWSCRSSLMMLSRAARVDDLPQPAGPVSSTIPWWKLASRPSDAGSPRSARVGGCGGITRKTASMPRCCR